jgi:hypothetical protein
MNKKFEAIYRMYMYINKNNVNMATLWQENPFKRAREDLIN